MSAPFFVSANWQSDSLSFSGKGISALIQSTPANRTVLSPQVTPNF